MRIDKDFDLYKEAKKFAVKTLKDIRQRNICLSEDDKIKELAGILFDLGDTRFCYNVNLEDGMEFIAENALDIQKIYQTLINTEGVEINPFKDLDECIEYIFRFTIEGMLENSDCLIDYLDEHDEGEVYLTGEIMSEIADELSMEKDMDFER